MRPDNVKQRKHFSLAQQQLLQSARVYSAVAVIVSSL